MGLLVGIKARCDNNIEIMSPSRKLNGGCIYLLPEEWIGKLLS